MSELVATRPLPERDAARPRDDVPWRAFLFVCGPSACWAVDLPPAGEIAIGRAHDATLRLDDDSVSREHAKLAIAGELVTISDLGSENSTVVNGMRIGAPRPLAAGDIIQLGLFRIVYSVERPATGPHPLVPPAELGRRLDDELQRGDGRDRSFAVAVARFETSTTSVAAIEAALELGPLDIAGWTGPNELAIVMPEVDAGEAKQAVTRIVSRLRAVDPEVRAGWAVYPDDGDDTAALLGGARAAAIASTPGSAAAARQSVRRIPLGNRTAIVAEPAMIAVYELVERLAASEVPVVIRGETGSGKDLVATAIHEMSPRRRNGPFVAINCAALPDQLLDSALFGHDKGAFTGATEARAGAFEAAHNGTLFLDEIGELALMAQAKVLRAIESGEIIRIGTHEVRTVDVRVVVATNRALRDEMAAQRFRQDLYYRLQGGVIRVPPLRDRRREIPILAEAFLDDACRKLGREPMTLAGATVLELVRHDWPGNVRELRMVVDYLAAAIREPVLEPWHVVDRLGGQTVEQPPADPQRPVPRFRPLHEEIADLERDRIQVALAASNGVQARAAALIGMPLRTFITKLKRYGIRPR
jgi:DNA-binding NtrC family response regulator